jgi:hypothetical protein
MTSFPQYRGRMPANRDRSYFPSLLRLIFTLVVRRHQKSGASINS